MASCLKIAKTTLILFKKIRVRENLAPLSKGVVEDFLWDEIFPLGWKNEKGTWGPKTGVYL